MASSTSQAQAQAEFDRLNRLLRGACRSLYRLTENMSVEEMAEVWGPEVLDYWMNQDEYTDERARRVLLSVAPADRLILNTYLDRHGTLPSE